MASLNPYQAPLNDEPFVAPRPDDRLGEGTKPMQGLGMVVVGLLGLSLLINLGEAAAIWGQIALLRDMQTGYFDLATAEASDARVNAMSGLSSIAMLATAIAWWIWAYRGNANVRALGAESLQFTAGSMVWWWFVPVYSLVRPYQGIAELAAASRAAAERRIDDWAARVAPGPIGPWWALYLAQSIVTMLAQRMSVGSEAIPDLLLWSQVFLLGCGLSVVALVLAIAVARQITADQVRAGVG